MAFIRTTMSLRRLGALLFVLATLASLAIASADVDPTGDLPECENDTEIQFYNAKIGIMELTESCTDPDLFTIGFLIQDVVEDVESRMPRYREESMQTEICPFPQETETEERRMLKENGKILSYNAKTGRCQRCKDKTTSRRRLLKSVDVCSVAKRVVRLKHEAEYAATESNAILERMKEKAANALFDDVDLSGILSRATVSARDCQEESSVASAAAKVAAELCAAASRLRSSTEASIHQVQQASRSARTATRKAKIALAASRQAERDLNTLYYVQDAQSRRGLEGSNRILQEQQICGYRDTARRERDRAEEAAHKCGGMLDDIGAIAERLDTAEAWDIFHRVELTEGQCYAEFDKAEIAANKLSSYCNIARRRRYSTYRLRRAEKQLDVATAAVDKIQNYFPTMNDLQNEMNALEGGSAQQSAQSAGTAVDGGSSQQSAQSAGAASSAPSFGIQELVLVDARRDTDIPGALDCEPVNDCFNGATRFNIRAKTFGSVDTVYLTSEGPIRERGRTEGK